MQLQCAQHALEVGARRGRVEVVVVQRGERVAHGEEVRRDAEVRGVGDDGAGGGEVLLQRAALLLVHQREQLVVAPLLVLRTDRRVHVRADAQTVQQDHVDGFRERHGGRQTEVAHADLHEVDDRENVATRRLRAVLLVRRVLVQQLVEEVHEGENCLDERVQHLHHVAVRLRAHLRELCRGALVHADAVRHDLLQVVQPVQRRHPDLREAVAQRRAQLLLAEVAAGVHRRENAEAGRGGDHLDAVAALLGHGDLPLALQNAVHALQHGVLREGDLVQKEDVAALHRGQQRTVLPHEDLLVLSEETAQRLVRRLLLRGQFRVTGQNALQPGHHEGGRLLQDPLLVLRE